MEEKEIEEIDSIRKEIIDLSDCLVGLDQKLGLLADDLKELIKTKRKENRHDGI